MRSTIHLLGIALAIAFTTACSSTDNAADNPETGQPAGSPCCPIDKSPGCCMNYGGWKGEDGSRCGMACDGMPYPSDPAWKIVKDEHGCNVWSSAGSKGPLCFGPPIDSGVDTAVDADARTDDADAGGHCCPPDPAPGCCMKYGGWSSTPDDLACGRVCDGMPGPGDPAWHLVKDEHGCDVWSSAGSTGPKCGAPFDAGADTSSDADARD